MSRHQTKYTMTNGKAFTVTSLAELTGLSLRGARNRLTVSDDYDTVIQATLTKNRKYFLSDGTPITTEELMQRSGLSRSACQKRLVKGGTLDEMLLTPEGNRFKSYTLDDGSEWTTHTLMDRYKLAYSTAYVRLNKYTDPAKVCCPSTFKPKTIASVKDTLNKSTGISSNAVVGTIVKSRMYYDPLGHWKLINRCT